MEFEGFKSAWQSRPVERHALLRPSAGTRSLQFVRTSAIRDLQRSDELSRFIFSLLFALVAVGVSILMIAPGAARVAAWLFALSLLVDGISGVALLSRRFRAPAATTMLQFISREHQQIQTQIRFERFSQPLMFVCAAIALLLLIFTPKPPNLRAEALDVLGRMAILTAFLTVAWRRAKSRSREVYRELDQYLKDFDK